MYQVSDITVLILTLFLSWGNVTWAKNQVGDSRLGDKPSRLKSTGQRHGILDWRQLGNSVSAKQKQNFATSNVLRPGYVRCHETPHWSPK